METITQLAHFFLISVALGLGIFSFLARTEDTGAGFMKLLCSICLGTLFVSTLLHVKETDLWNPISKLYYFSLVTIVLTRFFHKDRKSIAMWILYFLQNLGILAIVYLKYKSTMADYIFALSSIALLGVVTYAMTLGHWYLVVPKLSERPLANSMKILWPILALKVAWTGVTVFNHWGYFEVNAVAGDGYLFNWVMLLMRVGWGYLVLFVMSIFGMKLVNMRSIQSATGIFYAMVFFVFIGELISGYIFLKHGIYL